MLNSDVNPILMILLNINQPRHLTGIFYGFFLSKVHPLILRKSIFGTFIKPVYYLYDRKRFTTTG